MKLTTRTKQLPWNIEKETRRAAIYTALNYQINIDANIDARGSPRSSFISGDILIYWY